MSSARHLAPRRHRQLGQAYPALEGIDGLQVAYDVRLNNPRKTALFLRPIHETYKHGT